MEDAIVVIGSGVAGLRAAIEILENGENVYLFTKNRLDMCNTDKAQGGVAVVLKDDDNFNSHIEDTLNAGAGLCRREAVEVLVKEGPERIKELIKWGAHFDKNEEGKLDFTKEAAHSTNRILHALGDATGHEVERSLIEKVKSYGNIKIFENRMLTNIITEKNTIVGAEFLNVEADTYEKIETGAIILASGGYAAIYKNTTNPNVTMGDGIACAFLAGASVEDMEFVQFHPTALKRYKAPQFLLSESMRGEGAVLINDKGERFMKNYHRLEELAPRDVVARSIVFEMKKRSIDKVYLDARPMGEEFVKNRFPTIYNECLKYGLDVSKEAIPVAPAAHYTMGGIKTDVDSKTNINGLFAAGEAACNGVHGANRLASNSILEGLVYGKRAADSALLYSSKNSIKPNLYLDEGCIECTKKDYMKSKIDEIKERLWNSLGVVRSISEMKEILECVSGIFLKYNKQYCCSEGIELRNIALLSVLIAKSAIERKGSIGAHYCIDTPHAYDNVRHISIQKNDMGELF
jgi:L-aspartate oxidase